jgi:hypothetical protein
MVAEQAEGLAALGNKNIGGLDIAMDDALGVRCVEGVGNVGSDWEQGRAAWAGC